MSGASFDSTKIGLQELLNLIDTGQMQLGAAPGRGAAVPATQHR